MHTHKTVECRKFRRAKTEVGIIKNVAFPSVSATNHIAFPSANNFENRSKLDWFVDSAASRHMTCHKESLHNLKLTTARGWEVTGINNTRISVHGVGEIHFTTKVIFFVNIPKEIRCSIYTYTYSNSGRRC